MSARILTDMNNRFMVFGVTSSVALISCSSGADMANSISEIQENLEACAYYIGEPYSDIERTRFLLNEAEQKCANARKAIALFREKYPHETQLHAQIDDLISSNFDDDLDLVIERIQDSRKFYDSGEGEKFFAAEEAKANDPFPYTAIINCSLQAFKYEGIPVMACMSNDYNSGTLRVRSGDTLQVYQGWQLQNANEYPITIRGLEIPLGPQFNIKIENYKDDLLLSMSIIDNDENIIYQGVAEKYETLEYEQFESD